jgi:hypothetical protein
LPQLGVFAQNRVTLHRANLHLLVGAVQLVDLAEQLRAGHEGVTRFPGELLGGSGQAEEGQEDASDGYFDPARRVCRQIQNNQRQQSNQP